jgi:FlaA1/EpsC-like NDP-sugar epimerase
LSSLWRWYPIDAVLWYGSVIAAVWARYDFQPQTPRLQQALVFATGAAAAQLVVGITSGVYRGRYQGGSFEEAKSVAGGTLVVGLGLACWALLANPIIVPRSTPFVASVVALTTRLAARSVLRAYTSRSRGDRPDAERVIVLGAGVAGTQLVRQMRTDPSSPFLPVALLDDDPAKRQLRISGVRVRGTRADLGAVAAKTQASALVVAMPRAEADELRQLSAAAGQAGLHLLVLPPLDRIVRGRIAPNDLREVDVEDLLGRHPVRLDLRSITDHLHGKRVLVTGAGGSIGSELCRQIHRFGPAELIMLDRDESALHSVQLSITGRALLDGSDTALVDIRDDVAVRELLVARRPDVVFHAAALKHLPLLESHPLEAWKTNVLGTLNVLNAAVDAGVDTFVNISTDKAASPTSVLGLSKRVAERLTAAYACRAAGRYVSVRFGNVLGSRGSVLTTFERQIRAGGPVTVTDPDVTRFFMTISEACQLVLQASTIGENGQALVLDMGKPVRIADVAQTMIDAVPHEGEIEIVYTGLREGEKLHEDLFGLNEPQDHRPKHPLVSHVDVPAVDPMALPTFRRASDVDGAVAWMRAAGEHLVEVLDLPDELLVADDGRGLQGGRARG